MTSAISQLFFLEMLIWNVMKCKQLVYIRTHKHRYNIIIFKVFSVKQQTKKKNRERAVKWVTVLKNWGLLMGSQQGIAVHWKAPHVFVTSLAQTRRLCGPPGKCCGSNRRIAGQRLQHRNGGDLYSRKRVNPICWPLAMSGAASVQFHCEQHTRTQQAHRGLAINERAHRRRSGLVGEEDAPTWGHFFFFSFFFANI